MQNSTLNVGQWHWFGIATEIKEGRDPYSE